MVVHILIPALERRIKVQGQARLERPCLKKRRKAKKQVKCHREGVIWCSQGKAWRAVGAKWRQESDGTQGCSPCTMMKAVAWMLSTLLDAKHVYSPLSLCSTFCIYSPPEGVIVTRGSVGKGVRSPLVQVICGRGWPVALHSKVTLSPTSTSVFCGWITKVGRAVTNRNSQLISYNFSRFLFGIFDVQAVHSP